MLLHAVNSFMGLLQGSILLAGHANGDVNFWELKRAAWECVKPIRYKSADVASVLRRPQMPACACVKPRCAMKRIKQGMLHDHSSDFPGFLLLCLAPSRTNAQSSGHAGMPM